MYLTKIKYFLDFLHFVLCIFIEARFNLVNFLQSIHISRLFFSVQCQIIQWRSAARDAATALSESASLPPGAGKQQLTHNMASGMHLFRCACINTYVCICVNMSTCVCVWHWHAVVLLLFSSVS